MKLKIFFKILGLSLFLAALVLLMLTQNPKVDITSVLFTVSFGTVLAFSAACLITSEMLNKNEDLEKRLRLLEEEVQKLKQNNTGKEN